MKYARIALFFSLIQFPSTVYTCQPTVVGIVSDPTHTFNVPAAIAINGNLAYVTNTHGNSVSIIDINPTSPTFNQVVGKVSDPSSTFEAPIAIAISGNIAYVANDFLPGSVSIIDVNPSSPTFNQVVGTVTDLPFPGTFSGPNAIAINGNFAYVTNFFQNGENLGSVSIVDISSPLNAHVIQTVSDPTETFDGPSAIAISGGIRAYVTNELNNLVSVVDVNPSDPSFGEVLTTVNDPSSIIFGPTAIAISGNYAYVASGISSNHFNVSVIDINLNLVVAKVSDPSSTFNAPADIAISGNFAYVTNFNDHSVSIVDISNPINAQVIGTVSDPKATITGPIPIAINSTTFAYVGNNNNTVSIVQLVCVGAPTNITSCQFIDLSAMPPDFVNQISWSNPPTIPGTEAPTEYRIYRDAALTQLAATIPATASPLEFSDPNRNPSIVDTYYIVGVNAADGAISPVQTVTVNTSCVGAPTNITSCQFIDLSVMQPDFVNKISWSNPTTNVPATYNIYRDAALTQLAGTVPATASPLQFLDNNPTINTYYIVGVTNDEGSPVQTVTVNTSCVGAPTNITSCQFIDLSAMPPDFVNQISWSNPSTNVPTTYNIYRNATLTQLIATIPATASPLQFLDNNPTIDTYYIVGVTNDEGSSPVQTITVNTSCVGAPTNITGCQFIDLSAMPPDFVNKINWSNPSTNVPATYNIYRNVTLTQLAATIAATANPLQFLDPNRNPNVFDTYYIVGVSTNDKGSPIQTVTVNTSCASGPTNLRACRFENQFLTQTDFINQISWQNPASNAPTEYILYRDAALTQVVATIAAGSSLLVLDHNRNPNVIDTYYLVGVSANGTVSDPQAVIANTHCNSIVSLLS